MYMTHTTAYNTTQHARTQQHTPNPILTLFRLFPGNVEFGYRTWSDIVGPYITGASPWRRDSRAGSEIANSFDENKM